MSRSSRGSLCTSLNFVSFLGLTCMRRSRWPSWCQHDQRSHFCFQEYFTTPSSIYVGWILSPFWLSCFISQGWNRGKLKHGCDVLNSEQLHLSNQGRSEWESRFRDKFDVLGEFCRCNVSSSCTVFLVHLSPPAPHTDKRQKIIELTRIPGVFSVLSLWIQKAPSIYNLCPSPCKENSEERCARIFFITPWSQKPGWLCVTLSGGVTWAKVPLQPAATPFTGERSCVNVLMSTFTPLILVSLQGTMAN